MKDILLTLLSYTIIWAAVFMNRKESSKIALFSKWWWFQVLLVTTGVMIARYAYGLSHC